MGLAGETGWKYMQPGDGNATYRNRIIERFIIWKEKNWKKVQNMRLDKKDMVLYAVTDRHWLNGESLYSQVEKALKGGATFIQLREKNLGEEEFLQKQKRLPDSVNPTMYHL